MKRLLPLKVVLLISTYGQFSNADVGWTKFISLHDPVKIAVIDTGISPELLSGNSYCKEGHKDFTGIGLNDNHGHGTHISGIIDQYVKNFIFKVGTNPSKIDQIEESYCQIIIKYYDPKEINSDNLKNTVKAFRWAIAQKVNIINYSGGGTEFSKEEHDVVEEALNKGIKVVAAAGNERSNIDKHPYYPAMYDKRIYVVGNLVSNKIEFERKVIPIKNSKKPAKSIVIYEPKRDIASSSNYGTGVTYWEIGTNVLSRLPNEKYGYMTGTSQATAVKTGKLAREMLSHK